MSSNTSSPSTRSFGGDGVYAQQSKRRVTPAVDGEHVVNSGIVRQSAVFSGSAQTLGTHTQQLDEAGRYHSVDRFKKPSYRASADFRLNSRRVQSRLFHPPSSISSSSSSLSSGAGALPIPPIVDDRIDEAMKALAGIQDKAIQGIPSALPSPSSSSSYYPMKPFTRAVAAAGIPVPPPPLLLHHSPHPSATRITTTRIKPPTIESSTLPYSISSTGGDVSFREEQRTMTGCARRHLSSNYASTVVIGNTSSSSSSSLSINHKNAKNYELPFSSSSAANEQVRFHRDDMHRYRRGSSSVIVVVKGQSKDGDASASAETVVHSNNPSRTIDPNMYSTTNTIISNMDDEDAKYVREFTRALTLAIQAERQKQSGKEEESKQHSSTTSTSNPTIEKLQATAATAETIAIKPIYSSFKEIWENAQTVAATRTVASRTIFVRDQISPHNNNNTIENPTISSLPSLAAGIRTTSATKFNCQKLVQIPVKESSSPTHIQSSSTALPDSSNSKETEIKAKSRVQESLQVTAAAAATTATKSPAVSPPIPPLYSRATTKSLMANLLAPSLSSPSLFKSLPPPPAIPMYSEAMSKLEHNPFLTRNNHRGSTTTTNTTDAAFNINTASRQQVHAAVRMASSSVSAAFSPVSFEADPKTSPRRAEANARAASFFKYSHKNASGTLTAGVTSTSLQARDGAHRGDATRPADMRAIYCSLEGVTHKRHSMSLSSSSSSHELRYGQRKRVFAQMRAGSAAIAAIMGCVIPVASPSASASLLSTSTAQCVTPNSHHHGSGSGRATTTTSSSSSSSPPPFVTDAQFERIITSACGITPSGTLFPRYFCNGVDLVGTGR